MKPEAFLVLCNFPDREKGVQIATELVEKQLAACVNLLPPAVSIYRWEGKTETAEEIPALIKTTPATFPALEQHLRAIHPYEVPEIIALPVSEGSRSYLEWLAGNLLS